MVDSSGGSLGVWAASDEQLNGCASDSDGDDCVPDGVSEQCGASLTKVVEDSLADVRGNRGEHKFNNIAVMNSSGVHLGNKTVYNGSITINNYVYSSTEEMDQMQDSMVCGIAAEEAAEAKGVSLQHTEVPIPAPQQHKSPAPVSWLQAVTRSKRCVLVTFACSVTIAVFLTLILVFVLGRSDQPAQRIVPILQVIAAYPQENTSGNLTVVHRNEWHAQPRDSSKVQQLVHPVDCMFIGHTFTKACSTFDECADITRAIQKTDMTLKPFTDMIYSFVIGGDGYVYTGRGWDIEPEHPDYVIKNHLYITLIGEFDSISPPTRQTLAVKQLFEEGVRQGKLSPTYDLIAVRQLGAFQNPGEALYQEIQTWPHWTNSSHCLDLVEET